MSHSRRLFFKQGAALFGVSLLANRGNAATMLVKGVQHIEADKELLLYHSHKLGLLASEGRLESLQSLLLAEPGYGLLLDTGGLLAMSSSALADAVLLINALGIKASLLGAEYLNWNTARLIELTQRLRFPLVNCNYGFKNPVLANGVLPYVIYKTKMKTIGITGVGRMIKNPEVDIQDPIASLNRMASFLKKEKSCDVVICLSDNACDKEMLEKSAGVDMILGSCEVQAIRPAWIGRNALKHEVILSTASQEFISKSVISYNDGGNRIGYDHRHLMCSDPEARYAVVSAKIKKLGDVELALEGRSMQS